MLNLIQTLDGLQAFSLKLFCDILGQKKEEVLVMLAKVRQEIKSSTLHAMFDQYVYRLGIVKNHVTCGKGANASIATLSTDKSRKVSPKRQTKCEADRQALHNDCGTPGSLFGIVPL